MRALKLTSLVSLVLAAGVLLMLRLSDTYARFLAEWLSVPAGRFLSNLTAKVSFPVGEALALLLGALVLTGLVRAVVLCVTSRALTPMGAYAAGLCATISILMLSYAVLWAPMYHVPSLGERMGLTIDTQFGLGELVALCEDLTAEANRSALSDIPADLSALPQTTQRHLVETGVGGAMPQPVKLARYPELFKALGLAGVYIPWTGEALISGDEPPLSMPFLAAHESAHQMGYAREDEANYIAYLACMKGTGHERYSGSMYALYYAMEALHDADTVAWMAAREGMSKQVARDYYRMNGLRSAEAPGFVQFRQQAMAAFWRISRQTEPRSYGDMVQLLLAQRRLEK